ncbi:MAG: AIPR family protein [Candidatus Moraniibacteriota bacterium]
MEKLDIKLPVFDDSDVRKLKTMHEDKGIRYFVATISAKRLVTGDASKLDQWKEVNPRDAKESSYVWKSMQESLDFDAENFIYKNKGILLLVKDFVYDNKNKSINFTLTEKLLHGIVDGGHTFAILKHNAEERTLADDVYIKVEFIVGIDDRNRVADLAEARNTAAQVKDESIMNLKDSFQAIKRELDSEPDYCDKIAYKEYEEGKDISIKEILGYMVVFDNDVFSTDQAPIFAYSSKKRVLDYFINESNTTRLNRNIAPLLPNILQLRDNIYKAIPTLYEGRITMLKKTGAPDSIVKDFSKKSKKVHLNFIDREVDYKIPEGWVFPLLAAFRELLEEHNGTVRFKVNPSEFLQQHIKEIGVVFTNILKENPDPQVIGKTPSIWINLAYKIRTLAE